MRGYQDVVQCKKCKKIYENCPCVIPKYCKKCGSELVQSMKQNGDGIVDEITYSNIMNKENINYLVAKKVLFMWVIRKVKIDEC